MRNYRRDEDTGLKKKIMEIKRRGRMWLVGMFQVVKNDAAFSKCSSADVRMFQSVAVHNIQTGPLTDSATATTSYCPVPFQATSSNRLH